MRAWRTLFLVACFGGWAVTSLADMNQGHTETAVFGGRLFLVLRRSVQAYPWGREGNFRICRGKDAESELRTGVFRSNWPCRSDPGRIRSNKGQLRKIYSENFSKRTTQHIEIARGRMLATSIVDYSLYERCAKDGRR